eukprot:Amastigsp_a841449_44.p4 type:complete len:152 gc:universal Amastigsp_a841449_44:617-162(-)
MSRPAPRAKGAVSALRSTSSGPASSSRSRSSATRAAARARSSRASASDATEQRSSTARTTLTSRLSLECPMATRSSSRWRPTKGLTSLPAMWSLSSRPPRTRDLSAATTISTQRSAFHSSTLLSGSQCRSSISTGTKSRSRAPQSHARARC